VAFLDQAIRELLTANSAITAVTSTRIYNMRAPDNPTFPLITFQRISNIREHTMSGEQAKLTDTLVQVDCWARESSGLAVVRQLAINVRLTLDNYRGTASGVDVQGIMSQNESDSWDETTEVYRVMQQFKVIHRE